MCSLGFSTYKHISSANTSPLPSFLTYFLIVRDRGREGGREREKHRCETYTDRLPLARPALGTWPTTQACALTGNQTRDLSVCWPTQPTEPQQPGLPLPPSKCLSFSCLTALIRPLRTTLDSSEERDPLPCARPQWEPDTGCGFSQMPFTRARKGSPAPRVGRVPSRSGIEFGYVLVGRCGVLLCGRTKPRTPWQVATAHAPSSCCRGLSPSTLSVWVPVFIHAECGLEFS